VSEDKESRSNARRKREVESELLKGGEVLSTNWRKTAHELAAAIEERGGNMRGHRVRKPQFISYNGGEIQRNNHRVEAVVFRIKP